jgi:hypothetical protein
MSDEDKRKHLEFIQNIISRMANCSFLIRGWSVTLVAGLFALAAKDADGRYAIIPYIPVIVFWILDGYYLFQERLYRRLFLEASKGQASSFDLDASRFEGEKRTWLCSMFSTTSLLFHGVLLATVILVMFAIIRSPVSGT